MSPQEGADTFSTAGLGGGAAVGASLAGGVGHVQSLGLSLQLTAPSSLEAASSTPFQSQQQPQLLNSFQAASSSVPPGWPPVLFKAFTERL